MGKTNIATLDAVAREAIGTRAAKRLRAGGQVPIVLYGHGLDTVHLSVEARPLMTALDHGAHLLELNTPSGAEQALVREVQYNIYHTHILHADLTRVALDEAVEVEVPIELHGSITEGSVEHLVHMLTVTCRADSIPESIRVEIGGMTPGNSIRVLDLALPDGVETTLPEDTIVVSVKELRELEEAAEEGEPEGPETAEPEVIGEKEKADEADSETPNE